MKYASTVISLAKSQVGYKETGTNVTKYASDFDNKYPEFYNYKKQGVAWCDMFFDWLFVTSFGMNEALTMLYQPKKSAGAGCKYSYGYYKTKKQVGKEPKVGAQIFFSNKGTEADINHTGIVVKVEGNKVYTIEGNKNNQVSECTYDKSNKTIYGYGYPKYDAEPVSTPTPVATTKSSFTIKYVVKSGDTLNKIASKKYTTSVKAIADANGIADVNLIRVGQTLNIPLTEN